MVNGKLWSEQLIGNLVEIIGWVSETSVTLLLRDNETNVNESVSERERECVDPGRE